MKELFGQVRRNTLIMSIIAVTGAVVIFSLVIAFGDCKGDPGCTVQKAAEALDRLINGQPQDLPAVNVPFEPRQPETEPSQVEQATVTQTLHLEHQSPSTATTPPPTSPQVTEVASVPTQNITSDIPAQCYAVPENNEPALLRSEPGGLEDETNVVARINRGMPIDCLQVVKGDTYHGNMSWYLVTYNDGNTTHVGYIHSLLVSEWVRPQ